MCAAIYGSTIVVGSSYKIASGFCARARAIETARLIPVAEASLIGVLECMLGPLWVWLAIGERPGLFALIGGAVILSALVAHTAADLTRPRRPELDRVA